MIFDVFLEWITSLNSTVYDFGNIIRNWGEIYIYVTTYLRHRPHHGHVTDL